MAWQIDSVHSSISFAVRHLMITTVRGRFEKFSATVHFDEQDPALSTVEAQIEAASINTGDPTRDAHLRSPDFLDAERYPTLTFKSNRVEKLGEDHGRIHGDLTIRDVTREVVLDVDYAGQSRNMYGHTVAGLSAKSRFNRKDWGLVWNMALETGGWMVGDEIRVDIEVEMAKEPEAVPAAAAAAA